MVVKKDLPWLKRFVWEMANLGLSKYNKSARPFTVAVEGNIGSGKTTFLNHFKKYNSVCVLAEPIQRWRNCDGHNLLGLMYEDPQKWAFSFQSYVQLTMLQHHTRPVPQHVKLMERSIYSARFCFVEKMARDGIMPSASASVIDEWFKWLYSNTDVGVDLIVYLRTSPEVAYERILKRNRAEEKSVPFEYLQQLHEIHEDWLYHKKIHYCPAPVVVLNADLNESDIKEEYERCEPHIISKKDLRVEA